MLLILRRQLLVDHGLVLKFLFISLLNFIGLPVSAANYSLSPSESHESDMRHENNARTLSENGNWNQVLAELNQIENEHVLIRFVSGLVDQKKVPEGIAMAKGIKHEYRRLRVFRALFEKDFSGHDAVQAAVSDASESDSLKKQIAEFLIKKGAPERGLAVANTIKEAVYSIYLAASLFDQKFLKEGQKVSKALVDDTDKFILARMLLINGQNREDMAIEEGLALAKSISFTPVGKAYRGILSEDLIDAGLVDLGARVILDSRYGGTSDFYRARLALGLFRSGYFKKGISVFKDIQTPSMMKEVFESLKEEGLMPENSSIMDIKYGKELEEILKFRSKFTSEHNNGASVADSKSQIVLSNLCDLPHPRIAVMIKLLQVEGHPKIPTNKQPFYVYNAINASDCQSQFSSISETLKNLDPSRKILVSQKNGEPENVLSFAFLDDSLGVAAYSDKKSDHEQSYVNESRESPNPKGEKHAN